MPLREIVRVRIYRSIRDRFAPTSGKVPPGLSVDIEEFPEEWKDRLLDFFPGSAERAITQAAPLLENRITLFGREYSFASVIAWNRDPRTGCQWPLKPVRQINYRLATAGDPKDIWELNRHQFLPALGKAYFITGDERYAEHAIKIILSWIEQCPPLTGINWPSGIELAFRCISWLWTLKFVSRSRALTTETLNIIAGSIYLQVRHISRNLSLYSSANNHLISELAAMVILGHYLKQDQWVVKAAQLLNKQITAQILADGVGAEQATSYQLNTTELYVMSALVLDNRQTPLSPAVISRLCKSADFLFATMAESGTSLSIGDSDSARVLPISDSYSDCKSVLNLIAHLATENTMLQVDLRNDEKCFWVLGPERYQNLLEIVPTANKPSSKAFPEGGYYVLEQMIEKQRVTVIFDCGPLGMPPIAAHGHCDALSFILLVNGKAVLFDPGTYTYFSSDAWRNYFRGTSAHNTIRVDRVDQSVFGELFFANHQAQSECIEWIPGCKVVGRQFGYRRLKDPVVHTRSVSFADTGCSVIIADSIESAGGHWIEQFFHVDPRWSVKQHDDSGFLIPTSEGALTIRLDGCLQATAVVGDESVPLGWSSPAFGEKQPTFTIRGEVYTNGPIMLVTEIMFGTES